MGRFACVFGRWANYPHDVMSNCIYLHIRSVDTFIQFANLHQVRHTVYIVIQLRFAMKDLIYNVASVLVFVAIGVLLAWRG